MILLENVLPRGCNDLILLILQLKQNQLKEVIINFECVIGNAKYYITSSQFFLFKFKTDKGKFPSRFHSC